MEWKCGGRFFESFYILALATRRCFVYGVPRKRSKPMLITINTRQFQAEAATSVSGLPCWHSFDSKRRLGYVQALVGRPAS
jgi:hypothetical protein